MESFQQLEKWVKGESIHTEHGCVPDLSCCLDTPSPLYERERFLRAIKEHDAGLINLMMDMFITRASIKYPKNTIGVLAKPIVKPEKLS